MTVGRACTPLLSPCSPPPTPISRVVTAAASLCSRQAASFSPHGSVMSLYPSDHHAHGQGPSHMAVPQAARHQEGQQ